MSAIVGLAPMVTGGDNDQSVIRWRQSPVGDRFGDSDQSAARWDCHQLVTECGHLVSELSACAGVASLKQCQQVR